jgi:hypothetical protein
MSLPTPTLDDRSFEQLLGEARLRLTQSCPEWTDASPSDPGSVLLELFAYLTDQLVYRLNRVPDKVYVEFLRLLGVQLTPPAAARARLVFSRSKAGDQPLLIPRGTRVASATSEPGREAPVFATLRAATIPAGASEISVEAAHCQLIAGEDLGRASGSPGQTLTVRHAPIVFPTGDELDLVIGVEAAADEIAEGDAVISHGDVTYRIWQEVSEFSGQARDARVYIADRMAGRITFAPAARLRDSDGRLRDRPEALAGVPAAKRRMCAWYRYGGGRAGNLAANRLTVMKDPIAGVSVTNPEPATGGTDAETLENALERGPYEFYSLKRAVTAFDYELIARQSGAVSRARAYTSASLYAHATPGTVEVVLVPAAPQDASGAMTAERMASLQSQDARRAVAAALDERRPLGTTCLVCWGDYKPVRVRARVVVQNHLDTAAVRAEVLKALHQRINPLASGPYPGWEFGETLRVSHLYDLVLTRPGVGYMDRVALLVDDVPDQRVTALARDLFQESTWYAGAAEQLYMSEDDGDGWQRVASFPGGRLVRVRPHPRIPGLVALASVGEQGSQLAVSTNGGRLWTVAARTAFTVNDLAWMQRDGQPVLLMATDVGLYELAMQDGAVPLQILVVPENHDLGFFAVTVVADRGEVTVAVAAEALGGVYLSTQGGRQGTFQEVGPKGVDVRVLAVLQDGPRTFLWAGVAAVGNENGKGCLCRELRAGLDSGTDGWRWATKGWTGGSVHALEFRGTLVVAASHRAGVLTFDSVAQDAAWLAPKVECGLPQRDKERLFHPVEALAVHPENGLVLAGGVQGIYRGPSDLSRFTCCSCREFTEKVTLPRTWLFASGEHEIEVVTYDDLRGAKP